MVQKLAPFVDLCWIDLDGRAQAAPMGQAVYEY